MDVSSTNGRTPTSGRSGEWGDTAVVTAFLTAKGTDAGTPFSYCVWYTDTYIRTPTGWRYAHGQSGARQPGPV